MKRKALMIEWVVRQIDKPSVEVSILVNQCPEVVWQYVADITTPAKGGSELINASWLHGATEPSVGASFRGENRVATSQWETVCFVTEYTPLEVFEWKVESVENPVATWRFTMEHSGDFCTVHFYAQLGLARNGMSRAYENDPEAEDRILSGRLKMWQWNMEKTLEYIKSASEATPR